MHCCTLEELKEQMQTYKPNLVYISTGIEIRGTGDNVTDIVLKPLTFSTGEPESVPFLPCAPPPPSRSLAMI